MLEPDHHDYHIMESVPIRPKKQDNETLYERFWTTSLRWKLFHNQAHAWRTAIQLQVCKWQKIRVEQWAGPLNQTCTSRAKKALEQIWQTKNTRLMPIGNKVLMHPPLPE